ncbi:aspartyl protease [Rhizoctonia solani AG-3 Rhs1AP]|uniref:Aspartyl protease n=2 Tax=Rhizoctonia solani AG-3 TaxID=1086053 RepID=A0A074RM97_9AGAM|nr:aspartyl protease [Rhizoctonia solani AG-3 Rhs1AP]KEP46475.1 aspartyl protease [Rhizoctonia solani 123E]
MDIQIGKPAQDFVVIPSTYVLRTDSAKKHTDIQPILFYISGSPSTWLYSTASENEELHGKNIYDISKSKTAQLLDEAEHWHGDYADGSMVEGKLYADTIIIGGFSAEHQHFTLGERTGPDFPLDGVLALQSSPSNIFKTLVLKKNITRCIFSMYLSSGHGSELHIGGINKEKFTGDITYAPVLKMKDKLMVLGIVSATRDVKFIVPMIVESGIPFIEGPRPFVSKLWEAVGGNECPEEQCRGSGYYTYTCNKYFMMTFTFNDRKFQFTNDDLFVSRAMGQLCVGAIRAKNVSQGVWFLGTRFMKSVYTIFDMDNSQVGFATPIHLSGSEETPRPSRVSHPA